MPPCWVRTARGWRIAERINAGLDGSPGPRGMLAPPAHDRTPASGGTSPRPAVTVPPCAAPPPEQPPRL
ncbi:hypothetical protein ACIQVL_27930 [Streptomyces sp. NPDC090499]|uniref:hypothetical protein n=1 Tax=Streptomyces sp. NPDC090499 TaxID=3365965 RepID=UPI0037FA19C0